MKNAPFWSLLIVSHESQFSGLFGLSCSTQPLLNYNNGHYNGHINYIMAIINSHYINSQLVTLKAKVISTTHQVLIISLQLMVFLSLFMSLESRCATLHLFPTPPSVIPH